MVLTDRRIIVLKIGFLAGATLGDKTTAFALEDISTTEVVTRGLAAC